MNKEEFIKLMDTDDHDEYLKFDRIVIKRSTRPDLHAFLLLDSLLPSEKEGDLICNAEHDQYWIDINCDKLAKVITEAQVIELIRCGISYDSEIDSLFSFC